MDQQWNWVIFLQPKVEYPLNRQLTPRNPGISLQEGDGLHPLFRRPDDPCRFPTLQISDLFTVFIPKAIARKCRCFAIS